MASWPIFTSVANTWGTFTNTRSVSICTRWNSSRVLFGLSAETRAPGSTFRAVMIPENGATTFWNDCRVSRGRMVASFTRRLDSVALTLAAATLAVASEVSYSCCGTA